MAALTTGFQHVATITNDLDRLAEFYAEVFGAPLVATLPGPGEPFTRHGLIQIGDGVVLHPFERPGVDLTAWGTSIFDRGRADHYTINAASREAFDELRQRLIDRGATEGEITDFGSILSVGFDDPDGAHLELCWVDTSVGLGDVREPEGFEARALAGWAPSP